VCYGIVLWKGRFIIRRKKMRGLKKESLRV
jgi:hypothetical protein